MLNGNPGKDKLSGAECAQHYSRRGYAIYVCVRIWVLWLTTKKEKYSKARSDN